MFKHSTLLASLGLALTLGAGCALDTGSSSQDLDNGIAATDDAPTCARTLGGWGDSDVIPPSISVPMGDRLVPLVDIFADAASNPDDPQADLFGRYAAAEVNIMAGAEITEEEIDALVDIGILLELMESRPSSGELQILAVDFSAVLKDMNEQMAFEFPCQNAPDTIVETDYSPQRPQPPSVDPRQPSTTPEVATSDMGNTQLPEGTVWR